MDRFPDEILKKVVAKDFQVAKSDVQIISKELEEGPGTGTGYACEIKCFKVSAKVGDQEKPDLHYVGKVVPEDDLRSNIKTKSVQVDNEIAFYSKISPKILELRREAGLEPLKMAKCFYTDDETGTIIQENLKLSGFGLIEKSPFGAPDSFIEQNLINLAKIHSSTYHYANKVYGGVKEFIEKNPKFKNKSFFDLTRDMGSMHSMLIGVSTDNFKFVAGVIGDEHPELAEKCLKQIPVFEENLAKSDKPREDCKFVTLNHGDFWYNNIMAKFDENKVQTDSVIIDWQALTEMSVGADIQYFIGSSSNMESKAKNWDFWLKLYHDALTKELAALGYIDIYPYEDFLKDVDHASYRGFLLSLCQIQFYLHQKGLGDESNKVMDPEFMKGKSADEVKEAYAQVMQKMIAKCREIPGFYERTVAIVKSASNSNTI